MKPEEDSGRVRGGNSIMYDQAARVHFLALLHLGCATSSHCLDLSGPLLPKLQSIDNILSGLGVIKEERGQEKPHMVFSLQSM